MLNRLKSYNFYILLTMDAALVLAAHVLSYLIRFEGFPPPWQPNACSRPAALLVVKLCCFLAFGLYRGMWRYTSLTDMANIVKPPPARRCWWSAIWCSRATSRAIRARCSSWTGSSPWPSWPGCAWASACSTAWASWTCPRCCAARASTPRPRAASSSARQLRRTPAARHHRRHEKRPARGGPVRRRPREAGRGPARRARGRPGAHPEALDGVRTSTAPARRSSPSPTSRARPCAKSSPPARPRA